MENNLFDTTKNDYLQESIFFFNSTFSNFLQFREIIKLYLKTNYFSGNFQAQFNVIRMPRGAAGVSEYENYFSSLCGFSSCYGTI